MAGQKGQKASIANGFAPSKKSISAAKRDAAWLERIKTEKDPQALSDLFEIYRPKLKGCLLYTSPSPRDRQKSRMPSSA